LVNVHLILIGRGAFVVICTALLIVARSTSADTAVRSGRDISGFWIGSPVSFFFDPSTKPGQPPNVKLQPEYDESFKTYMSAKAEGERTGHPLPDASTLCLPGGMPLTMMAFFPMEIIVTEQTIYVIPEGVDLPRRIYLDGRAIPPPEDLNPTFTGFSVGRWEGNTLVVVTAGVKTKTRIDGVPHSELMRTTERIRLLDDDTLEIVFSITDPKAFKEPWVITRQYKDYDVMNPRIKDYGTHPDHKKATLGPSEVVCNENNRDLAH
jgi:hypothetical protein